MNREDSDWGSKSKVMQREGWSAGRWFQNRCELNTGAWRFVAKKTKYRIVAHMQWRKLMFLLTHVLEKNSSVFYSS